MFQSMLNSIFGKLTNSNDYKLSHIKPLIAKINDLESKYENLSQDELKDVVKGWKEELWKLDDQTQLNAKLDELLPDVFAVVRESAKRTMNQRHRDVQLIAGITLHQGKVAEQKTGEGKTLTATLPLFLNALTGKGAHLVTPNDYLSKHGAGWYGPVYDYLGLKVGVIVDQGAFIFDSEYVAAEEIDKYSKKLKPTNRAEAYAADITYGTNSQFGFDYLRDNMVDNLQRVVQKNPRGESWAHNFAIVDEVDSILIDFARTPLIISSVPSNTDTKKYLEYATLASQLVKDTDYDVDEKDRRVTLTEIGINKIERKLGVENLYEKDFETIHRIENALRAKEIFIKDKDYVVKDGEVLIVDQFTGRILQGNRWSEGLHQAVEAKENVAIKAETKTVATISYQNYFRLYKKLAGMTGTAQTEAEELFKIYSLDVVSIPTYKPVARTDRSDYVYKTESAKYRAIAEDIGERNKSGQPVLIGTTSVEKSQLLGTYLKKLKVPHEVLNAKNHTREAMVIAQAGQKGAVTVATNMAGRGVDIILGGDPFDKEKYDEVIASGGLYVIGTERHESRRIDNQLRGRSGRQGDVGESRFYISLQDDLMRIFGGDQMAGVMTRLKVDENIPIESGMITKVIENSQKKVESLNFDRRKSIVDYDDVMNVQRETVYGLRRRFLFEEKEGQNHEEFLNWVKDKIKSFPISADIDSIFEENVKKHSDRIWAYVVSKVSLDVIDVYWTDHIDTMAGLRDAIRLRHFGNVDVLVEYKREARDLFDQFQLKVWEDIADKLSKVNVNVAYNTESVENAPQNVRLSGTAEPEYGVATEAGNIVEGEVSAPVPQVPVKSAHPDLGRNDPCWCGSGKKYKKCHYPN